jgi:phosphoglycolate phosphatase
MSHSVDQMKSAFELVIFDFDGTLADSFPWLAGELKQLARRWSIRAIEDDDIEAMRHMSAAAIIRHLGLPSWKVPWIAADLRARMARDIARIPLFAGVPEMLDELAASRVRLAIASSNAEANVARVLGRRLFQGIEAAECGASLRGKHLRIQRLLRRLDVPAEQAVYIGDEVRDIAAARHAGTASVAVSWGYNRLPALRAERPDLLLNRVEDIPKALRCPDPISQSRPARQPASRHRRG